MSREDEGRPVKATRLQNTVRLEVLERAEAYVKERFGRDFVVQKILQDLLNFDLKEILCLQDFARSGYVDITFNALRRCYDFMDLVNGRQTDERLKDLKLEPLFVRVGVPLVVHTYNPYLPEEDIRTFLRQYCYKIEGGEKMFDKYGLWTGRRMYKVTFWVNKDKGIKHPPGSFAIGQNRGFLWYPGQPFTCRRCGASGHSKKDCEGKRCRVCGKEGHCADRCLEPKKCSLCGSIKHLYRTCPKREQTYASALQEAPGESSVKSSADRMAAKGAAILEKGKKGKEGEKGPKEQKMETSSGQGEAAEPAGREDEADKGKKRTAESATSDTGEEEEENTRVSNEPEDKEEKRVEGKFWSEQVESEEEMQWVVRKKKARKKAKEEADFS